jgi:hypothetical protein
MNGTIELVLRRTGTRGRAAVDRLEKFPAEYSVKDGALRYSWTATNGQRNDLDCPLTPEFRATLIEALGARKGEGDHAKSDGYSAANTPEKHD